MDSQTESLDPTALAAADAAATLRRRAWIAITVLALGVPGLALYLFGPAVVPVLVRALLP